jgi:hypothetical protein
MGLGFIGISITFIRYTQGRYVVVPASAPFIDRAIWVGGWACLGGGFCALFAMALIVTVRAWRDLRSRRRSAGDA